MPNWKVFATGLAILLLGLGSSTESRAQFPQQLINQPCTACSPSAIHVADLNGDSRLDVLVSTGASFYPGDGKLAWYGNTSDGFSGQNVITTEVTSFQTVDLDGDGDRDIIASISDSDSDDKVVWYENLDDGGVSSTPRTITSLVERPDRIRTADLVGDNSKDIFFVSKEQNRIFLLENTSGGFSNPKRIGSTSRDYVLASADADGDGDEDLLTHYDGDIVWYENTPSGFSNPKAVVSNVTVNNLYTADLNGDDETDLLTTSYNGGVAWYKNQDGGVFSGSQNVITPNGRNPTEVIAADLDGDNDRDVIYSSESGDKIAWHENLDGEGISETEKVITTDAQAALSVFAADLDSDDDKDVLSASGTDDKIAWYQNQIDEGQGFVEEGAINTLPDLYKPQSVVAADIDGDNDKDVITASKQDDKISWYRNLNAGGFSSQTVITTDASGVRSVHAADLDGDGDKDVLSASEDDDMIAWHENVDDGGISSERTIISTNADFARSVYAADLDGDGDKDVLSASLFDDKIAWYENQDAGFSSQKIITTNAERARSVYAADLDGDGDKDVLSASEGSASEAGTGTVSWYENLNSGGFSSQNILTNDASGVRNVTAADLDADGDKDVLYATGYDEIAWHENLDSGGVSSQANVIETFDDANLFDNVPQSIIASDLDGDSKADVLAIFNNTIGWYENLDNDGFSSRNTIATQVKGGTSLFAANLDQDFDADILSASSASHRVVWYENTIGPERPSIPASLTATATESETVELKWNAVSDAPLQNYRIYRDTSPFAGSPDDFTPYDSIPNGGTSYTDETDVGRTYYYRLTAVDENGRESGFSKPGRALLYPQEVNASFSRTFGETTESNDYRLVALPGQVDRPISDAVSGQAGVDWQAYYDDGSDSDYLVEHDGSDTFRFESGNGFWLTSTADWTIKSSISAVSLRGDSAAVIGLQEGWNVISNPLEKDVVWRRVDAATSDALQPIWAFDGTFSQADTFRSAANGVGYYFFNDDAERDSLVVPYPDAPIRNKTTPASSDSTRMLSITATATTNEAAPRSTVRIGLDASADLRLGDEDFVAPPNEFANVSLRLKASDGGESERSRFLMAEQRPPPQSEGHTFRLQLTSRNEKPVTLTADALDAVQDHSATLLYPSGNRSYNLRRNSEIRIEPSSKTTVLQVAIGSERYIESKSDAVRPETVQLTAYPNPMAQEGTIEYTLPEEMNVTLRVYDVLGRQVATLERGRKQSGRHTVQLDTDRLSSGLYFGRLRVGDQTLTQKITIFR